MESYLFRVALKKGIYTAVKAIVALVVSAKAVALEKKFGVTIDPQTFQVSVGSFLFMVEHDAHMYLKNKYPNVSCL